ncbi:hypothetical protein NQ317_013215 [Molorchus minor]|uniref:Large ribosomal subunit protein eL24 n=1 Tax=Molorchus minor TaxID=1323400 RepID=A0ABQ9IYM0_9CUCU|nr:hypothetical protein NQ317_013215 [Molorchus minor]
MQIVQSGRVVGVTYFNYSPIIFNAPSRWDSFTFLNSKCERAHLMKRNPRKVTWTVLYRRKHKKGQEEEATKKRTRRTQKFQRAIVGASLNDILAKRNQRPEMRKAQREQAIRAAKEQKKSTRIAKKAVAPSKTKLAPKQKVTKNVLKSAPRVGGKQKVEIIRLVDNDNTHSSLRPSKNLNISKSKIWKCLENRGKKPFKPKFLHTLEAGDTEARMEFCLWLQGMNLENPEFLKNTDEAAFTTNGIVSSQNRCGNIYVFE